MGQVYNEILDGQQYHNDDITVLGEATIRGQKVDRINLVTVNTQAAYERGIRDIRRNIAARIANENLTTN